jgi:hypothetical protein
MKPEKMLRNLDNNYWLNPEEKIEVAKYIRQLQGSNEALAEGMMRFAEEIVALRRDLSEAVRDAPGKAVKKEEVCHCAHPIVCDLNDRCMRGEMK